MREKEKKRKKSKKWLALTGLGNKATAKINVTQEVSRNSSKNSACTRACLHIVVLV